MKINGKIAPKTNCVNRCGAFPSLIASDAPGLPKPRSSSAEAVSGIIRTAATMKAVTDGMIGKPRFPSCRRSDIESRICENNAPRYGMNLSRIERSSEALYGRR